MGATLFILAGIAIFVSLGLWQLERRAWKLDLIATVEQRVDADPVAAPGPSSWPEINAAQDAYRHVQAGGRFMDVAPALVQAVTRLGPGYWVLAPFMVNGGFVVLVNRGFVTKQEAAALPAAAGTDTTVTGLLRISEPGGAFLRGNDPKADRWYSRDVAAIAAARGLEEVAPYFIDADATDAGVPVGGLTVVQFRNAHLLYAVTWFGLAAMLAGWALLAFADKRRSGALTRDG
ncbi:MAG: SURF1 family protein [Hyphomicrobiales bacterium]|nr:SURF1 family protein [Hyphomicrobiales bacterium]